MAKRDSGAGYDPSAYPPFAVTVDIVVFTIRDGHLQVQGDRLQLKDAESGRTREYEMRYQAGQLALRTPEGDVLVFLPGMREMCSIKWQSTQ